MVVAIPLIEILFLLCLSAMPAGTESFTLQELAGEPTELVWTLGEGNTWSVGPADQSTVFITLTQGGATVVWLNMDSHPERVDVSTWMERIDDAWHVDGSLVTIETTEEGDVVFKTEDGALAQGARVRFNLE